METLRIRVDEADKEWLIEQAGDDSLSSVVQELITDERTRQGDPDRVPDVDTTADVPPGHAIVDAHRFDRVESALRATAGTLDASPQAFDRVRLVVHADSIDPDLPDDIDPSALNISTSPRGIERVVALATAYDYLRDHGRATSGDLLDDVYPRATAGVSTHTWRKLVPILGALPEIDAPQERGANRWQFHPDRVPDDTDA